MKIFWHQAKGYQCDECDCSLEKKISVLIGEGSNIGFEEDTRQASVCIDCIKKALHESKSTFP